MTTAVPRGWAGRGGDKGTCGRVRGVRCAGAHPRGFAQGLSTTDNATVCPWEFSPGLNPTLILEDFAPPITPARALGCLHCGSSQRSGGAGSTAQPTAPPQPLAPRLTPRGQVHAGQPRASAGVGDEVWIPLIQPFARTSLASHAPPAPCAHCRALPAQFTPSRLTGRSPAWHTVTSLPAGRGCSP